jgi:zinc protease
MDPELFKVYAQARPGETATALESRIAAVLDALADEPVPPDELTKAKNQLRADLVRGLKTVGGKAEQLGFFEVMLGDYRKLLDLDAAWDAVTADDIRRVARERLVPTQRTVVVLVPLSADGSEKGKAKR